MRHTIHYANEGLVEVTTRATNSVDGGWPPYYPPTFKDSSVSGTEKKEARKCNANSTVYKLSALDRQLLAGEDVEDEEQYR